MRQKFTLSSATSLLRTLFFLTALINALSGAGRAQTTGCSAPNFLPATLYATGAITPSAITVGDFNMDGNLDIATANFNSNFEIQFGRGDGSFGSRAGFLNGKHLNNLASADFNGDGKLDMVAMSNGSNELFVLPGNGSGGFGTAVVYSIGAAGRGLVAKDFNGDDKVDLAFSAGNALQVMLGKGDGTFLSSMPYAFTSSASAFLGTADFNGDGKLDIVFGNSTTPTVGLFLGVGDGTFSPAISIPNGNGRSTAALVVADFNNDNKPDLGLGFNNTFGQNGYAGVLLSNGDGTFTPSPSYLSGYQIPTSVSSGDFNNDGKADLVVGHTLSSVATVFFGNGDGTLTLGGPVTIGGTNVTALLAVDVNKDNSSDLLVTVASPAAISVLVNACLADQDGDGDPNLTDCAPSDPSIHHGAVEVPDDGIDQNCDGLDLKTWYLDADADGFGSAATSLPANSQPANYVANKLDCDDSHTTYADNDNDGFGAGLPVPCGVATNTDCNDANGDVHPGAIECPVIADQCANSTGVYTIAPLVTANDCDISSISYVVSGATSRDGSGTDASGAFNPGINTITWTVNHLSGAPTTCQSTLSIIALAKPVITASGPLNFYTGGSVVLTATPAASYLWSNGATTQAITVTSSGSYSVRVGNSIGCTSAASDPIIVTVVAPLSISSFDGDGKQLSNNTIRPYLQINNESNAPIAYSTLSIRYWLTVEDFAPMTNIFIDWAQLGTNKVKVKYVKFGQPRAGAFGYIEYRFDASAGNLGAGGNSGPIQSRAAKSDWTNMNEVDDYSYAANSSYLKNAKITAYKNGALVWGVEPESITAVQSLHAYSQDKSSGASTNSISTFLKLNNEGNQPVSYKDITMRYWLTADGTQALNYYLDYAVMGNSNIKAKFVKLSSPLPGADTYLELSFTNSDSIHPSSSTGNIQQRIAKSDWSMFSQANDHSYKSGSTMSANNRITVYVKGVLVSGNEPAGASPTLLANIAQVASGTISQDQKEVLQVKVLNNPIAANSVEFMINGVDGKRVQAALVDLHGRIVSSVEIAKARSGQRQHLPIGNYAPGLFVLKIITDKQAHSEMILKAR